MVMMMTEVDERGGLRRGPREFLGDGAPRRDPLFETICGGRRHNQLIGYRKKQR